MGHCFHLHELQENTLRQQDEVIEIMHFLSLVSFSFFLLYFQFFVSMPPGAVENALQPYCYHNGYLYRCKVKNLLKFIKTILFLHHIY